MPAPSPVKTKARLSVMPVGMGPGQIFQLFTGLPVPDPITFVISEDYLDRANIYPRQATLLKIIFLRLDILTAYDHAVIDEWEDSFRETGNNGIVPGVRRRMAKLRQKGAKWFRETLLVMGRRAGKGHISGLSMAYVLWNYMAKGDPQRHYGVDRDKKLVAMVFAGKRDQAKATVWQDAVNYITGAACFAPYIRAPLQAEKLSVYAPHDFVRMRKLSQQGINPGDINLATFEVVPKESTLMAGRGPTSFCHAWDEMAHVVASGANRSAEEVYCLGPATRVLKADLTWAQIDDLVSGDRLVALDEDSPGGMVPRKLREATVVHKWDTQGTAYRITLDDGTSVVCSGNHRWLRSRSMKSGTTRWATIMKPSILRDGAGGNWAQLRVGDYIQHLVDPWETDETRGGGYLSGVYDGEGHVRFDERGSMKIGFAQNPGPVRDQVLSLLKEGEFEVRHDVRKQICQSFQITGLRECFRFLGTYRPLRLLENARNLWQGRTVRGTKSFKQVVSIETLPEQRLVDIETTTGTFIAEGLVSHNSAAKPSLDQFGKDAFIIEPSSPWQMLGQYYVNYCNALLVDEQDEPVYLDMLMVQLTSWDIYKDWEIAHEIAVFPEGFKGDLGEYEDQPPVYFQPLRGAIQAYDDQMALEEQANPDTFKVERRSHFAVALDAYLNEAKVKQIFQPWTERLLDFGGPMLAMQERGRLDLDYKAHGDPSKSNANFGLAMAHAEPGPDNRLHVVFDKIHHFEPKNFEDHIVDYDEIEEWIWASMLSPFMPTEMTFDQFNSAQVIQRLAKRSRKAPLPKVTQVYEKTASRQHNWQRAEIFKTAVNMGWVHAPYYELAELELRFLQEKNGVVDHPDSGPVQTKDVADAMMECVMALIGDQIVSMRSELGSMRPQGALLGGVEPFPGMSRPDGISDQPQTQDQLFRQLGGFTKSRGMRPDTMRRDSRTRRPRY